MTGASSPSSPNNPPTRFKADFVCPKCGCEVHVSTYLAVVQGPGLERQCPTCGQVFLVMESGATPITEEVREFIDAAGKPYIPKMPPTDPPIQPRFSEENDNGQR
jgi:transcription elongation factor Elf1